MTPGSIVILPFDARPIPGWSGYYATPNGEIWSTQNNRGHNGKAKLRRLFADERGYSKVMLSAPGKRPRYKKVHRLMMATFAPPRPSPTHHIRHLDGDPSNNRISNLCWGTPKENTDDRARHGRTARGERSGGSKLTEAAVRDILIANAAGLSRQKLADKYRVNLATVRAVVLNISWKHVERRI